MSSVVCAECFWLMPGVRHLASAFVSVAGRCGAGAAEAGRQQAMALAAGEPAVEEAAGEEVAGGGFFSRVPSRKPRLWAGAEPALARRHLPACAGDDADRRRPWHRADVPAGGGKPDWILPFSPTTSSGGGGHGGAQPDSADRARASPPVSLSPYHGRTGQAGSAGEP